jgi:dipeptidyl aminopeptidase/acylaminoacyl peptidase
MHEFLLAALLFSAASKPYTIEDQVALKRLQGFKVSPNGKQVVFTLRSTDLAANKGRTDLWTVDLDTKNVRQLTSHEANDSEPVFVNDKTVLFLSSRSGSSQVFKISIDGGEAVKLTNSPIDIDSFVVSRDGTQIAFAAEAFPECPDLACTVKKMDEQAKEKSSGRMYDSLMFRHWDTFKDGRRAHLFVQKLNANTAIDVTKNMKADAPSKPFGGSDEYTFSPDGKSLVFTARDVGREEAWSTDLDLFEVPADGSKAPLKLTSTNRATDTSPQFSPDGKTLAYVAMSRPKFEADKLRLVLREVDSKKEVAITEKWDRSVSSFEWANDGKSLYVTADELGQHGLFRVTLDGTVTRLMASGNVLGAAESASGIVMNYDSLAGPADLYLLAKDGNSKPVSLTQVNAEATKNFVLGEYEQFSFEGANKETVYGYVVKPVGFDAKKKYPLAFLIHGGPQGSFGNHWHYRWNPQVYAGAGFVAVMIDFHGSTGYGQAFTDSISNDWGGKPLEDLQKGLAAALAKYSFIDRNKRCALGASYGGFMINWIAGTWPDGFQCLVNHDGNLDEHFAYFDTEELWFPEWEHGGTPWENKAGYSKANPIDHISKWKTPMLVVHGGKDFRVVETQGMATFTTLQRKNIPSKFLYFPDENHWILKPANSLKWHHEVLNWLNEWTKK